MNPQPEPPYRTQFVLTDSGTVTIVDGARAIVIDRKAGKVTRIVPEMPILENQATAFGAGAALLHNTEGMKGVEQLRQMTGQFLVSTVETVAAEVKSKSS